MQKTILKIIGVLVGIILLGFFIKSFLISSGNVVKVNSAQDVVSTRMVGNVQVIDLSWGKLNYFPQVMVVKKDIPLRIVGDTSRLQGCFRSVVIPAFKISKVLTAQDNILEFTPDKVGDFPFSCAMGMGTGVLRVE